MKAVIVFAMLCASAHAAVLQTAVNPSNGHTYHLLAPYDTNVNSWNAIRAEAASLGGDLTSIQDAAEDAWIYSTFGPTALAAEPASNIKSLLIGMNDISAPWSWIDGAPTTYTNWVPTEPHSAVGDGEDYGGILLNFWEPGKWHDLRFESGDVVYAVVEVPEPSTFVMACVAIAGMVLLKRRRN